MSNKERRFLKKVKAINELDFDLAELDIMSECLLERLLKIQELEESLNSAKNDIQQFLLDRSCFVTTENMKLLDGTDVDVYIVTFDDEYIMYANGVYAKAKCHPEEKEFDPVIGYALCRARLILKLLEQKYIE